MEVNHYIKSINSQSDNSRYLLLLVDSVEAKDRINALEILGQLLKDIAKDSGREGDAPAYNSLKISISFSILTRCDDISAEVRAKALAVLSQTVTHVLDTLNEIKNLPTLEIENPEDVDDTDLDVNGNHRYFWYLLRSHKERRRQLTAVIRRRTSDYYVAARKAAFSALANSMMFDQDFVFRENLERLKSAALDASSVIRKQSIQHLSALLESWTENPNVQALWLTCILPLTDDLDVSVESKALSVLEDVLLLGSIPQPSSGSGGLSMVLLRMLSSGEFLPYQRFLKNAFCKWKSMDKLKPDAIEQLKIYIGTEWEECVWFYISNFALHCAVPYVFSCLCIEHLKDFQRTKEYTSFTMHILKVLLHVLQSLPPEILDTVHSIIRTELEVFSVPTEFIPIYIDILLKIHKQKGTKADFDAFSCSVIQNCLESLAETEFDESTSRALTEEVLIKIFCTMSELCVICPSHITSTLVAFLKKYSVCDGTTESQPPIASTRVKAHAFAALGKICLQDKPLAMELLPVFGQEVMVSQDDVIRNNASVILADLCKRYPSFADVCIPLISQKLKDKVHLIRYQTIVLLTNLLQDSNIRIKWQYPLIFGLLSALTDKKNTIRRISEYALRQHLQEKGKSLFYDCFIDSIFILNYFAPKDNDKITQFVEKFNQFPIPGEMNRNKRMIVYRFLLLSMSVKEKAHAIALICAVLTNVAQSVYPLNGTTECIIRDCFAILTCDEIRLINFENIENADDVGVVGGTELLTRKHVIINPVIPVISSLKNVLGDSESNIICDLISFVKELLGDFLDEVQDILAADKVLLKQIEYEIKKDAEMERRNSRIQKESLQSSNKQPRNNPCTTIK